MTAASNPSPHAALVADICRFIETAETLPSLDQLAQRAGLSPYHFQRLFKRIAGVTPKQFADAHRQQKLRAQLADGASITDTIIDAGYNSNSRFYENADAVLGMTPTRYRQGGVGVFIYFAIGESSLGAILVAQSEARHLRDSVR